MKGKTPLPLWPIVLFIGIFINKILFLNSSVVVQNHFGDLHSQVRYLVLIEDAGVLALILVLSLFFKNRSKYFSLLLIFFLCTVYLIDNIIIQSLYARFTLPTVYKYYQEVSLIRIFLADQPVIHYAAFGLILGLIRRRTITLPITATFLMVLFSAFFLLPWILFPGRPNNPSLDIGTLNVIRINQQVVFNRHFSAETILKTQTSFPTIAHGLAVLSEGADLPSCTPRPGRNLIVLLSESLSQVDSIKSGGLFNRLPRIDRIQEQGLTLTNVVADGYNTSDALAAIFLGIEPLPARVFSPNMLIRFPPRNLGGRNLVALAKKNGYKTMALTNASLSFEKNKEWLAAIGFDYIFDGESDLFKGQQRFTFDAPPDEVLYARALSEIRKLEQPFVLFLLTVSLHRPYLLPEPKDLVQDNPFLSQLNYVDRTTWEFYKQLQRIGFFNDGVLLLLGDHRRMAQLEAEEMKVKGVDSYGRVIGSFIGPFFDKGKIDHTPFNHSDLNTIMHSIIAGCELATDNLAAYHKYRTLGLEKPFTIHLLNEDLGLLLIRAEARPPMIVKLHGQMDPNTISDDPLYTKLAAYLVLNSARLGEKQHENEEVQ